MALQERPQIDSAEAARRLKTTLGALSRRAARGSIPGAFRPGKVWQFDEATFEAWRRDLGDPNAKPASAFSVDPLPFGEDAEKGKGDAA